MEKKLTENQLRFFNRIRTGDTLEGKVIRITRYGAFIQVGSISGLLHISEITYGRIKEVEDHLHVNQKIKVKLIGKEETGHQLKFSLRQMHPHPWESLINHYHAGDTVVGHVTEVKPYGAFLELKPGFEVLIHVSDVQEARDGQTALDFFKPDETYQAKIIKIDKEKRQMQLSLKE